MVAWLLYLTGVGAVIGLAGLLAERGLRHLGRPVRWVWLCAMVATIGWAAPAGVAGSSSWSWIPAGLGSPGIDMLLLAAWITVSLVLLGNVRLAAWTVRRNERSWRRVRMGGEEVLMSRGFGPGVIGAARPRIVLPEWVRQSSPSLERLILVHEIEHMRTRDTTLLLAGVIPVLLVPWCMPLWWQLHRLRRAIETDCDARVLSATADPRGYANALLAVAGRGTRSLMPVATLAPGRGELERRIRLITGTGSRSRRMGLGLVVSAVLLLVAVWGAPVPAPPNPNLEFRFEPPSWSATEIPREAAVILSIHGEDPGEEIHPEE